MRAEAERLLRSAERKREQKKEISDETTVRRPAGRRASRPGVSRRVRADTLAAVCSLSICGRKRSARVYARVPG